MTTAQIPTRLDLLWPVLKALETLGGSASVRELSGQLASDLQLPDWILDIPLRKGGSQSKVNCDAAWARTYLKVAGAIDNSSRGVWAITDVGRAFASDEEARAKVAQAGKDYNQRRRREKGGEDRVGKHASDTPLEEELQKRFSWRDGLLEIVRTIPPAAFERLCQRILREAGFTRVEVTGGPCDGGVDGVGVLRISLLSFHVMFQCKRFTGSVGAPAIRDFRGAMTGGTDKGLFITTGTFTAAAKKEAVRAGAAPIDLIEGKDLCDLLKQHGLGVKVVETAEGFEFDDAFFKGI